MRFGCITIVASALLIAAAVPASANPKIRRGPTAPRLFKEHVAAPRPKLASIAPERTLQIQAALVKAGYLSGTPSGVWDAPTQAAMEKLQGDNGWQTKLVPDSRAIIHLGLGPNANPGSVLAVSPGEERAAPAAAEDTVGVPASNQ